MESIVEWLVAQWTSRFGDTVLTMGDLQPQMHVGHIDDSALDGELLWWQQPFSCAPGSPLNLGAPEETWSEIGRLILTAAGVDSAPVAETQSTYLEIVRQSMGGLAQDIGQKLSTEVTAQGGAQSPPELYPRHSFRIEAELAGKSVTLFLVVPDGMCQVIASDRSAMAGGPAENLALQTQAEQALAVPETPGSRTFELLLDVELPLSVSFGRTSLKLQDALKLITGSLIELDRSVSDPVELLVNNCVIARGEVVVVEGNYGVRITEIISQRERLQQTRRYMLQ